MTGTKSVAITVASALAGAALLAGCGSTPGASTSTGATHGKKIVIGFSQAYTGNTWRKLMDSDFVKVANKLKAKGQISGYDMLDANNSVSTQVSQIDDLILKHVSLLIVDPASSSGLNGAIAKAKAAGIPVLVVDSGPISSSIPYELNANNPAMTKIEMKYVAKKLKGKGNVLVVRGIAGNAAEQQFYQGMQDVFKKYPKMKNLGDVYGNWTESTTESAVASILPSLPKINAIETEGGETYGVLQAFKAAGRPVPSVAIFGNRGPSLQWWCKHNSYQTISLSTSPWVGGAALYVAMDILHGMHVKKNMTMPMLEITNKTHGQYCSVSSNSVAQKSYSNAWVTANIVKGTLVVSH